ncbi:MAG TPA: hypothetical protein ENN40_04990 [Candidatus Aminicenantes bacterium]|nr:hypothetical protein [Candidatus Aminicenantes bacterium]
MLKISLSGLPGSGVNALLTEARKILGLKYRVEVVEPVRLKNPFDNSSHSGFISCFFDISTQINEENIRSISHPDLLVCNRSVLDHWVFWNREMRTKTSTPQLVAKHELIQRLSTFWMPSYDCYFLIRLDLAVLRERLGPVASGEYTPNDLDELDKVYHEVIGKLGIQVVEIWNSGSIDETTQKLVAALGDAIPGRG